MIIDFLWVVAQLEMFVRLKFVLYMFDAYARMIYLICPLFSLYNIMQYHFYDHASKQKKN